ncbi:hypothetical protein RRG08_030882 [Elysia crispata]|uniref:Uncharacterized protein n=1 Tax=Elysia crispata TaxID=231223 RepID=A0AAE0XT45_9GAST|nr:hypothetical protein RRG08_030882 [Elysia crispata]
MQEVLRQVLFHLIARPLARTMSGQCRDLRVDKECSDRRRRTLQTASRHASHSQRRHKKRRGHAVSGEKERKSRRRIKMLREDYVTVRPIPRTARYVGQDFTCVKDVCVDTIIMASERRRSPRNMTRDKGRWFTACQKCSSTSVRPTRLYGVSLSVTAGPSIASSTTCQTNTTVRSVSLRNSRAIYSELHHVSDQHDPGPSIVSSTTTCQTNTTVRSVSATIFRELQHGKPMVASLKRPHEYSVCHRTRPRTLLVQNSWRGHVWSELTSARGKRAGDGPVTGPDRDSIPVSNQARPPRTKDPIHRALRASFTGPIRVDGPRRIGESQNMSLH